MKICVLASRDAHNVLLHTLDLELCGGREDKRNLPLFLGGRIMMVSMKNAEESGQNINK